MSICLPRRRPPARGTARRDPCRGVLAVAKPSVGPGSIAALVEQAIGISRTELRARRAESDGRQSEALFRALFETSGDLVIIVEEDGRIRIASPSSLDLLGVPATSLVGRQLADFAPPGNSGPIRESYGRTRTASADELVLTEVRLRRALFDAITDAVFVHEASPDPYTARFITVNEPAARMLGYTTGELLALRPADIDDPEAKTPPLPIAAQLKAGRPVSFEQFHRTKDGRRIPVEVHSQPFELDGRPVVLSLVRDISERRKAEEELRRSEALYRLVAETMKDVVWILDTSTMRFRYVSPSVERLRGYSADEVLAHPVDHALTERAAAGLKALIQERAKAFLSGEAASDHFYTNEVEQPCRDDSTVWTEVVTRYYRNPETGQVEASGVTRDITARRASDAALRVRPARG